MKRHAAFITTSLDLDLADFCASSSANAEPSAEPSAVAEVPSVSPSAEPVGMNAEARAAAEREAAVAEMAALEAGFESD